MSDLPRPIDDWTEYKRLVLSELERLNHAIEKLSDQYIAIQHQANKLMSSVESFDGLHISIKSEIIKLDAKFIASEKDQQKDTTISSRWGFWAAVVSIVGSLIVSIISMIVAIY